MAISTTERGWFKFPEFIFPSNLLCGNIYNKSFQDGDSFQEIREFLLENSIGNTPIDNNNFESAKEYFLERDALGVTQGASALIFKDGSFDFMVAFGCRDSNEWDRINDFLTNHKSVYIHNKSKLNLICSFQNFNTSYDRLTVLINLTRADSESSTKISISFKQN